MGADFSELATEGRFRETLVALCFLPLPLILSGPRFTQGPTESAGVKASRSQSLDYVPGRTVEGIPKVDNFS